MVGSDAPDTPTGFRRVLVALDLSPASTDVLSGALALTSGEAEQLTAVHAVKVMPPPTETNFAAAWLTGTLDECEAAAVAYAAAVVEVSTNPGA